MDAFFAAVEQRDHPEYQGKPLIVGGIGGRGVVATASYEARKFGVHSALPMATARRLCPQGIFVSCDHEKYSVVSEQIMQVLGDYSPLVEPLSLDEAFLDLSGMELLYSSPVGIAREIKRRIHDELKLTISAGLAPNKFLAKIASDLQKPDGLVVVEQGQEARFLQELPIERLWGVGTVTAESLRARGVTTIGQLTQWSQEGLSVIFGQNAATIYQLVRGQDERQVLPGRQMQSIGAEETFEKDLTDPEEMRTALMALAERVGFRLRRGGMTGRTVALKLRYSSFQTLTKQRTLPEPTQTDEAIYRTSIELLEQRKDHTTGIRLLGVTLSHLEPEAPVALALFENREEKERQLAAAMDRMRIRFGAAALTHGRLAQNRTQKLNEKKEEFEE